MATIMNLPGIPPAAASRMASTLLNKHSPGEISDAIEILIDVLDLLGGDPDLEDNADAEPDDDAKGDPAWIEWQSRGRHKLGRCGGEKLTRDRFGNACHEDDEDDDPAEDDDPSGQCSEDEVSCGPGHWGRTDWMRDPGPGCNLADPGGCDLMR